MTRLDGSNTGGREASGIAVLLCHRMHGCHRPVRWDVRLILAGQGSQPSWHMTAAKKQKQKATWIRDSFSNMEVVSNGNSTKRRNVFSPLSPITVRLNRFGGGGGSVFDRKFWRENSPLLILKRFHFERSFIACRRLDITKPKGLKSTAFQRSPATNADKVTHFVSACTNL